jgi:hypothetical protein
VRCVGVKLMCVCVCVCVCPSVGMCDCLRMRKCDQRDFLQLGRNNFSNWDVWLPMTVVCVSLVAVW